MSKASASGLDPKGEADTSLYFHPPWHELMNEDDTSEFA